MTHKKNKITAEIAHPNTKEPTRFPWDLPSEAIVSSNEEAGEIPESDEGVDGWEEDPWAERERQAWAEEIEMEEAADAARARLPSPRVWVLGAADPEMEEIERILRLAQEPFILAVDAGGNRVHGGNAMRAATPPVSPGTAVIAVECAWGGDAPAIVIDHHDDDPHASIPPERFEEGSSLLRVMRMLGLPAWENQLMIGAADHCLRGAYEGRCPGVDPQELWEFRIREASRRALGRPGAMTFKESVSEAEKTLAACLAAPEVLPGLRDMRREGGIWHALPEVACRAGVGYIAGPLVDRDGRRKITASGDAMQIRAFIAWAKENGLVAPYGAPERGFAGAYIKVSGEGK